MAIAPVSTITAPMAPVAASASPMTAAPAPGSAAGGAASGDLSPTLKQIMESVAQLQKMMLTMGGGAVTGGGAGAHNLGMTAPAKNPEQGGEAGGCEGKRGKGHQKGKGKGHDKHGDHPRLPTAGATTQTGGVGGSGQATTPAENKTEATRVKRPVDRDEDKKISADD